MLGDSHAALFAHAGWRPGYVKATYGTGSSIMSLGDPAAAPSTALCLTVAWDDGAPAYALEGNIRVHRRDAHLAGRAARHDAGGARRAARRRAATASTSCPAFGGLGAPWWDDAAVGLISGLTLRHRALPQLARAALESIAFQVEDVVAAVDREAAPVDDAARRRRADREPRR